MPDFDTRKPQEPDRPSRLHMFVVASRQYMSAVGRWRPRMPRHPYRWALGMSLLPLLVIAVATMGGAIEEHLAYKLDKDVELKPTPAYDLMYENPALQGSSPGDDCEFDYADNGYSGYECLYVITKATDAVTLASITNEVVSSGEGRVSLSEGRVSYGDDEGGQVEFSRSEHDWYSGDPQAISYCFDSKETAVTAVGGVLYQAELLGKIDSCYIAVYTPYVYVSFVPRTS
jgi:hypothetical protein